MNRLSAVALACLPAIGWVVQPRPPAEQTVQQQLRSRLEHVSQERPILAGAESIYAARVLPPFYERRLFAPAWTSYRRPSKAALELVVVVRDASSDGLVPAAYHLEAIEELLARAQPGLSPAAAADLDLLLTDAFLILGAHLVSGRVDPETLDAEWVAYRREVDLASALERAVTSQAPRSALGELRPSHAGYGNLRRTLANYRGLARAGGWGSIEAGPALRPGDSGDRILQLRARLAVTDIDSPRESRDDAVYDGELEIAVRRFQGRHGLAEDGVVGEQTLAALNVPVGERERQIEINLERWRWLPQDLGDRYVLVNIPAFNLIAVENSTEVLSMRVAVGKSYRRTPVFSDTIRYLVLSPFWEVPHRLAVEDKLPEMQKDPGYLARLGFKVYQGWGADQVEVDPTTVDWAQLGPSRFPYRLRQDPGPLNALGRVKFMFPNRFDVYLHDTPAREVFPTPERDVSSGCIRLEKPFELAELLLASSPRWNRETLAQTIATGKETIVPLDRPAPVHILYWTAWADDAGTVHFLRDVYGRDALLRQALVQATQGPQR